MQRVVRMLNKVGLDANRNVHRVQTYSRHGVHPDRSVQCIVIGKTSCQSRVHIMSCLVLG
jgi:hypothetical protein